MTVSYNLDVVETSFLGFLKLQLRWRGSIWKSVLLEFTIFATAFAVITGIYRHENLLTEEHRKTWDNFAALFDEKMDYIPLTFMLGFFVTIVVGRWNEIFNNIGWIDNTALIMSTYLRGGDEKSRMLRRNVIRYLVLTQVLIFRDISMQVRKRFPTLDTVVAAGLMNEPEKQKFDELQNFKYNKYFIPIQWAYALLFEARQGGKLSADLMLNEIIKHITEFRNGLAKLCNFDWVPIPLVYPQVVFLAVRSYFCLCLIARQSVMIDGQIPTDNQFYPLVPFIMTALQFIFYVGWMKVAESLMNPLGEDDDDFECNFLIDRNLTLGLTIVDETYNNPPPQQKDIFWSEQINPLYSADSANKPMNAMMGSVAQVEPNPNVDEVVMMPHQDSEADVDASFDCGEGTRLLPRGISIVSVNRVMGSKSSLASRNRGFFESVRNKFTRDSGRLSRPNKLVMSRTSLNTPDGRPTIEVIGGSTFDIMDELVAQSEGRENVEDGLTVGNEDLSPKSPTRRTPCEDILPSVAEEDEDHQKTRTSVDLLKWKQIQEEYNRKKAEEEKKD